MITNVVWIFLKFHILQKDLGGGPDSLPIGTQFRLKTAAGVMVLYAGS